MSEFRYNPPLDHWGDPAYMSFSSHFWIRDGVLHCGLDVVLTKKHDKLLHFISTSKVVRKGYRKQDSGNYIEYEADFIDGRKWRVLYAHMRDEAPYNVGDHADVGQWAGIVGGTGNVSGEHVHIEIIPDYGPSDVLVPGYGSPAGQRIAMRVDPLLALENWRLVAEAKKRGY